MCKRQTDKLFVLEVLVTTQMARKHDCCLGVVKIKTFYKKYKTAYSLSRVRQSKVSDVATTFAVRTSVFNKA